MNIRPGELVIGDTMSAAVTDMVMMPTVNGERKGMGAVPAPDDWYKTQGFRALPSEMPLIPRSEWKDRIAEKIAQKSQISDILIARGIPSTDQNGHGYCWAYSTGGCVIALRALQNSPYVKLNPHSVAAIIKGGRDEGGWCGLSAQFLTANGIASEKFWPEHSRSLSNDTSDCRANMALHKVTEDWVDLGQQVYDRNLTFDQLATCLLLNIPCAVDFNWWGHSVMAVDLVDENSIRIRNSWTDGWGDRGFSVLTGSKAKPNGAVGLRVTGGTTE